MGLWSVNELLLITVNTLQPIRPVFVCVCHYLCVCVWGGGTCMTWAKRGSLRCLLFSSSRASDCWLHSWEAWSAKPSPAGPSNYTHTRIIKHRYTPTWMEKDKDRRHRNMNAYKQRYCRYGNRQTDERMTRQQAFPPFHPSSR